MFAATPPVVCGENEVETCKFDDDDTELRVCKPTCDCKANYSRDSSGQCVPDTPCREYFKCHEFNLVNKDKHRKQSTFTDEIYKIFHFKT